MADHHSTSFDYFDLNVEVNDEGTVYVRLVATGDGVGSIQMDWDTFMEAVAFAAIHGLGMNMPTLVPYEETMEAAGVS